MLNGNEFLMIWKVESLPLGLPCPRPLFQPQAECFLHHIRPQWASISSHYKWSPLATATSFLWYSFRIHQTRSSCAYDFILSSVSSNFPARHRLLSSPLWLPGCLHDTKSNCLCLIAPQIRNQACYIYWWAAASTTRPIWSMREWSTFLSLFINFSFLSQWRLSGTVSFTKVHICWLICKIVPLCIHLFTHLVINCEHILRILLCSNLGEECR